MRTDRIRDRPVGWICLSNPARALYVLSGKRINNYIIRLLSEELPLQRSPDRISFHCYLFLAHVKSPPPAWGFRLNKEVMKQKCFKRSLCNNRPEWLPIRSIRQAFARNPLRLATMTDEEVQLYCIWRRLNRSFPATKNGASDVTSRESIMMPMETF